MVTSKGRLSSGIADRLTDREVPEDSPLGWPAEEAPCGAPGGGGGVVGLPWGVSSARPASW